jgi:hypothetical protein
VDEAQALAPLRPEQQRAAFQMLQRRQLRPGQEF